MITLYQFRPIWGLPNASPFCMKIETYLRMAHLPFQIARHADVRKAPKKKLPYIDDDGKVISDSGFIIDYFKATYGDTLDRTLTRGQQAQALALRRLLEEHLYWTFVYDRWMVAENWPTTRQGFFGFLPAAARPIIAGLVRRQMRNELCGHGMGRHSTAEIYELGMADLSAIATVLGDRPYVMGEQPTSLDASAYAFLANGLMAPFDSRLTAHARGMANIVEYCERMRDRYYAPAAAVS